MSKQQQQQQELTPIIMEHEHEGNDIPDDETSSLSCFRLFCCFDTHDSESAGFLYQQPSGDLINQDTWIMKRVKSVKEYSELVAGPKWKNFIRRFSKKPKWKNSSNTTPFQYDPQSYALNFNDGSNYKEDDDLLPRSFSTRFAPPSRSTT